MILRSNQAYLLFLENFIPLLFPTLWPIYTQTPDWHTLFDPDQNTPELLPKPKQDSFTGFVHPNEEFAKALGIGSLGSSSRMGPRMGGLGGFLLLSTALHVGGTILADHIFESEIRKELRILTKMAQQGLREFKDSPNAYFDYASFLMRV